MPGSAPISPPRRRSSLGFSRVFICSSPPKDDSDEPKSPHKTTNLPIRTPSNTSQKRMPASTHRSTVTPGHVAQMQQKLLQSAKAALRMDMAFAASPAGSIGSRLPLHRSTSPQSANSRPPARVPGTPSKDWRFSMAPQALAGLAHDVREPFNEGSPTLPENLHVEIDDGGMLGVEPISSGFTSPIGYVVPHVVYADDLPPLPSSPPLGGAMDEEELPSMADVLAESDLEGPMTGLKVCSDDEAGGADTEESPTLCHLRTMSAHPRNSAVVADELPENIVLSEPARAAAESARAKRGLFRTLFPKKENGKSTTPTSFSRDSPEPPGNAGTPCPDPALHRLINEGKCPDPSAHLRHPSQSLVPPGHSVTPEAFTGLAKYAPHHVPQYAPSPIHGAWHPPPPHFHRVTATGSPMPFARTRSRPTSPGAAVRYPRQSHYSNASGPHMPQPGTQGRRSGTKNGQPLPSMATEHFQPGWYYAREPARPAEKMNPMTYSFSTAAAKVGGHSSAPDSRIRESYRTDTLTPLARAPNRFKKTGIGAAVGSRGINRFYGDNEQDVRSANRREMGTERTRRRYDDVQFRSSPPRQAQRMQSHYKRRRPREFEDEHIAIHEDEETRPPRLEKDDSVMEVDEETRAAVRLSIFGAEAPEPSQRQSIGLKELSPNVKPWRKGLKEPSKKKRRPSYWDGDLKQVGDSPAGDSAHRASGTSQVEVLTSPPEAMVQHGGAERKVCTSPAKEDIENVEEQTGVIAYDAQSVEAGVTSAGEETGSFVTGEEHKGDIAEHMDIHHSD